MGDDKPLYINENHPTNERPENDFRVLVLVHKTDGSDQQDITVDQSEAKGKLLRGIHTFDGINIFFDSFDEHIAYPNEGSIKYDVGSDGFIVVIVDTQDLRKKVLDFIDDYLQNNESEKEQEDETEEESNVPKKKSRK